MASVCLNPRQVQVQALSLLLGDPAMWTTPCVFLYGHHSSGKSIVTNSVLQDKKLSHVIVNCIECYSDSSLLSAVLQGLSSHQNFPLKCDNANDFIRNIRTLLSCAGEATYIVFEKAEVLRKSDLLAVLLRLQSLTQCNICVIFISTLPWDKFSFNNHLTEPAAIHFPSYTKDELAEILCHFRPHDVATELYHDYVTLLLAVFTAACRDLRELQHVAASNFGFYVAPINDGQADLKDRRKLWRNIESHFHSSLQKLYLREKDSVIDVKSQTTRLDLPFYSKFLLIATYICSYNPISSDRRFFVKRAGRMKRKTRVPTKVEKNCHLSGPKPFELNRLMAVFYSIIDGRVPPSGALFSQITSLTSLHLLARLSSSDQIDSPRYKCLASLSLVTAVAKTVDFDLVPYLYDFL